MTGVAANSTSDRETALWVAGADEVERHGGTLFATFPSEGADWQARLAAAQQAVDGAPIAAELLGDRSGARLVDGCKALVDENEPGFFQAWFYQPDKARAFAESVGQGSAQAGATVILPVTQFRKRLAIRAHEAGGIGCWLPAGPLEVTTSFYHRDYRQGDLLTDEVTKAIQAASGVPSKFVLTKSYRATVGKSVTHDPLSLLAEIVRVATSLGVVASVHAAAASAMAHALGRVNRELALLK